MGRLGVSGESMCPQGGAEEITNLEQLLDRLAEAGNDRERVFLGEVVEALGTRSFGPLLLMAGLIVVSPLSGIPGMPTTVGVLVLLISAQLLFGKERFWIPRWMVKRSVKRKGFCKAVGWLRPPARTIDRWLRPRLSVFSRRISCYVIAGIGALIAAGMPMMELVPFSSSVAGVALAVFGLALIAQDGLLALLAFVVTGGTAGVIVYKLV